MAKILLSTEEQKYLADSDYLKKDVRRLTAERAKLEGEVSSTAKKISDLKDKQISLERKAEEIILNAEKDAKVTRSNAKQVEVKANEKRSEIEVKLTGADDKQKELNNLLKSNEGKEQNLDFEKSEVEKIKSKLITIVKMIKSEVG